MIDNPNLPQSKINLVVMSGEYPQLAERVEKLGINCILTSESSELPYNERYHADMQIHNAGYKFYFLQNNCSNFKNTLIKYITEINLKILPRSSANVYPYNISLNGAHIGDYFISNTKYCCNELLQWYINNGIKVIDVNQGYSKCSTAIISHNAIITDDESIYNKCRQYNDIDVLKISKGSVQLNGYDYGFIGGCCFKLDENNLGLFGDVKTHNDYEKIKSFCKNYSVELISLINGDLIDIGGTVTIL